MNFASKKLLILFPCPLPTVSNPKKYLVFWVIVAVYGEGKDKSKGGSEIRSSILDVFKVIGGGAYLQEVLWNGLAPKYIKMVAMFHRFRP